MNSALLAVLIILALLVAGLILRKRFQPEKPGVEPAAQPEAEGKGADTLSPAAEPAREIEPEKIVLSAEPAPETTPQSQAQPGETDSDALTAGVGIEVITEIDINIEAVEVSPGPVPLAQEEATDLVFPVELEDESTPVEGLEPDVEPGAAQAPVIGDTDLEILAEGEAAEMAVEAGDDVMAPKESSEMIIPQDMKAADASDAADPAGEEILALQSLRPEPEPAVEEGTSAALIAATAEELEQAPAAVEEEGELPEIESAAVEEVTFAEVPAEAAMAIEAETLADSGREVSEEQPAALPGEAIEAGIGLTMERYTERLNLLEEQRRAQVAAAIARHDEQGRDRLQRELVLMNDRLAQLADSYSEELECYRQALAVLVASGAGIDARDRDEAMVRLQAGEPQAAEDLLARISEQDHPLAARAALHAGQLAERRVDLQRALDLFRRAVSLEADNPQVLYAAGKAARSLYQYKEALPWLESYVRLTAADRATDPLAYALAQRELAYTYVLSGQYQKAGPLYKESMTALARHLGQDHPEMAVSWYQIGELQETLGEYDKAVSLYKKSLEILEQKRGSEHPSLAGVLNKLAALCMELEMEPQAVPLYERLVRIREKALRPTHPQLALSLTSLAESYRLQGRYADAEGCYQKSLKINEALHGPEHPSVAAVLQELAKLCTSQRKPDEARVFQERAAAIFQKSVEAAERKTGQESLTLEL